MLQTAKVCFVNLLSLHFLTLMIVSALYPAGEHSNIVKREQNNTFMKKPMCVILMSSFKVHYICKVILIMTLSNE